MLTERMLHSKHDLNFHSESFLEQIVSIDSQVKNLSGIEEVQLRVKSVLDQLGFETSFIKNSSYNSAPLLLASKKVESSSPTISFIGHSDVVTPIKINPFRIDTSKNRIYGSGIADDKGGITVCLQALATFFEKMGHLNLNLNIVISPSEETGSIGFHDLFKELGTQSDLVFGLEPALKCGSLITSRSGNRWYHLNINGISAHSGRFGHEYINASHALSKVIAQIHNLNSEKDFRRVNVGSFGGGHGGFNTICGSAWAKIDTRFSNLDCRELLHKEIEKILQQEKILCPYSEKESMAFYSVEDDCPPMSGTNDESEWYQKFISHINKLEIREVKGIRAGGAADINYFATKNSKLLDGLGPVGDGLHTSEEFINRSSLHSRAEGLSEFLLEVNENVKLIRSH